MLFRTSKGSGREPKWRTSGRDSRSVAAGNPASESGKLRGGRASAEYRWLGQAISVFQSLSATASIKGDEYDDGANASAHTSARIWWYGGQGSRASPGRKQDKLHRLDRCREDDDGVFGAIKSETSHSRDRRQVTLNHHCRCPRSRRCGRICGQRIYGNKGEMCSAGSRLLVDPGILDDCVERFEARTRETVRIGDPWTPRLRWGRWLAEASKRAFFQNQSRKGRRRPAGAGRSNTGGLRRRSLRRTYVVHRREQQDANRARGSLWAGGRRVAVRDSR
jgi:Aldehyde dehydrogenase family